MELGELKGVMVSVKRAKVAVEYFWVCGWIYSWCGRSYSFLWEEL